MQRRRGEKKCESVETTFAILLRAARFGGQVGGQDVANSQSHLLRYSCPSLAQEHPLL